MDLPKKKWSSYVVLSKKEKTHPFDGESKDFLAVTTFSHALSKNIAKSVLSHNPGLELYDISHPLLLHYSAFHNLFIFCHFTFAYDEETKIIKSIESNNDRWDLEYNIPSLRTLNIKSKFNPKVSHQHKPIILEYEKQQININLANEDKAFHKIYNVIKEYDPDIILSDYGDNIIFPFLIKQLNRHYLKNIFSRDSSLGVKFINASSIESYGRVIHRKQQSLLFGRHHIDRKNMSFYTDLEIEIVFEIARISGMSLQEVSRSTPGRAVASLEIIEALKTGTCIPYRKQKPEIWRDAEKFLEADRGGLIFQPLQGVHENIISADFDSMFPSIMVFKNLSPETIGKNNASMGVIPRALKPLLERRLYYKSQSKIQSELQEVYKNRSDALKWLLVVSFGYTGFKNAPLSSPNIFEQINKWGRIALIQTKDIFEEQGFDVLHIYIDSIFVKREEPITDEIIDSLLIKVKRETGLPISLECIYKWVVFLPSKVNSRYVVPNSYFGVFQNGDIKARGIQCRRGDKPPFVKNSQIKIIEMLAEAKDLSCIRETFPQIFNFIMKQVEKIKQGQIPIEDLIITQRLSKNIEDYIMPSHVAKAGIQLKSAGVDIRAGSKIKFIYIKGNPRVLPCDLVPNSKGYQIDIEHYISLFKDAVKTVLIPFSIEEDFIENLIKLIPAKQLSFIPINERLRKFKISSSEDSNYYLY